MNSKKRVFNNKETSINNQIGNEEKKKSVIEFKYNNINNNSNNSHNLISRNKDLISKEEKNKFLQKKIEDLYNFEIYKNSISQYNFGLYEEENTYLYNTITVFNSFHKKNLEMFASDKNRSFKFKNNIFPINLSSELNLSFENKSNRSLILGNSFNKDNLKLNNIIRIFDKSHKYISKINQKIFPNKYNHYFLYKNRINNYNYLKFKKVSKFSKKEKKKELTEKYNTIMETHIKLFSDPIKKEDKNKFNENNIILSERKVENTKKIQTSNEFSTINGTNSTNKIIFNSIINEQRNKLNDMKLINKENDNNFIKNKNIPIGLSKKITIDKANENINSIDNNNRNSINYSRRFFYKYKANNDINIKSKSILEENEKININQTINEAKKIKDNIKKEKIIKIENLENNRIQSKKVQRNNINKNSNSIYISNRVIKEEINLNVNKEKNLNKTIALTSPKERLISLKNEKNVERPINIIKRKNNILLNKENNDYPKYHLEKNKDENSIQVDLGKSMIQSHKNKYKSYISDKQNNIANLNKTVINSIIVEDTKHNTKNNLIKLNDKNLVNNRSFIYKSDKLNKTKNIFPKDNQKDINSPQNKINQNESIAKEIDKIEGLKLDRFKRRNKYAKKVEGDNNNLNHVSQGYEILNLTNTNKNDGNPFRDQINYFYPKKINNRYENHRFHEISSTSCEKNIKIPQNHKEKKNYKISNKADNKENNQLMSCSSMRYIHLRRRINGIDNNKEKEKKA